jgi:hypothetical protein
MFGEQCNWQQFSSHSLKQAQIWTRIYLCLSLTHSSCCLGESFTHTPTRSCVLFKWTQMDTFPVQLLFSSVKDDGPVIETDRQTVVRLFVRPWVVHSYVCLWHFLFLWRLLLCNVNYNS